LKCIDPDPYKGLFTSRTRIIKIIIRITMLLASLKLWIVL